MAAGHDHGGEIRHEKPLWWALGLTTAFLIAEVIGGILSSTALTLLVLPLLYRLAHRKDPDDEPVKPAKVVVQ